MSRLDMSSRGIAEFAAQGGQHDALFELGLSFCTGRDGKVDLIDDRAAAQGSFKSGCVGDKGRLRTNVLPVGQVLNQDRNSVVF